MSAGRRQIVLLAAVLVVVSACAPASERPVRGAVPGSPAATPPGLPPTLAASDALRQKPVASPSAGLAEAVPSPSPAVALPSPGATPSPSVVAAPPIVRTIVPSANGHVPAGGPVTLSAVLVGRTADLESASLSADGSDAGAQIEKRSPRDWTIHTSQNLSDGPHTVRVLVRDTSGLAGGFTWQIVVDGPQPKPEPPASPPRAP
jgi:hypothetical protein